MLFSTITVLAALVASTSAAKNGRTFAVNHFYGKGPLVTGRMDPIVNPGVPSSHEHVIQGGNAFGMTLGDTTLMSSTCTSSLIKDDLSAYWTPSVYFQDPATGQYEPVPMFYMNVYYFFEETDDDVKAFPTGLRMVIGNPSLRTPPATSSGITVLGGQNTVAQPVQFTCPRSDYNKRAYPADSDGMHGCGIQDPNVQGAGVGFPDIECDGYASPLRADVHFPSCYNPAAGLDNYKENMAFPTGNGGKQNCPAGWIHVPHLFYEVYWNTPLFAGRWTPGQCKQPFVLSNGDKTGYSLHGDFLAGWKEATLQNIIDNCNAGDSGMENCPGIATNDRAGSCNIANPLGEVSSGKMGLLPGGLSSTGFGAAPVAAAPAAPAAASTSKAAPAVAPSSAAAPAAPAASSSKAAPAVAPSAEDPYAPAASTPAAKSTPTPNVVVANPATPVAAVPTTMATVAVSPAEVSTAPAAACGVTTQTTTTLAGGWKSIGCWSDQMPNRVLSGIEFMAIGNHQVTASACMAGCAAAGFTMAGVEWGSQCFCGNMLSDSEALDASECNMPCEGDKSQMCGGSLALNVYSLGSKMRRRNHLKRHVGGYKA